MKIYELRNCCFGDMCIKDLIKYNEFSVRHKKGDHEGAHILADVFLEGEIFVGYHADLSIRDNGDVNFHFKREREK